MFTPAPNWVGTGINAIFGTRGLSGFRRRGFGQDDGSGGNPSLDITGLVPATGPDANQVAALQVGNLATQVSSSGGYSINPSTGQLVANIVPGVTNQTLLLGGAVLVGLMIFFGGKR